MIRFVKRHTCTVSRHTFHRHLLATAIHQQDVCLILLKAEQSAFTQASFSSLSDIHECSGGLKMTPSSLDKQTAGCESPHNWLMSLAMLCMTCGGENGTSGSHLAVFSEDVAFACHFVATRLPPTLPSYRNAVLATPVKKLSKMAGNSASYPVYSRYSELL